MLYGTVPDISRPPIREYIGEKIWIKDIIYRCLENDAEKRYRDAGELLRDVERHIYPEIDLIINVVDSDGKPLKATIEIPDVKKVENSSKMKVKVKPKKYDIIVTYRGMVNRKTVNIRSRERTREVTIKMPVSLEKEELIKEIREIQNRLQNMPYVI